MLFSLYNKGMDRIADAAELLRKTESALRTLVKEAATEGDYEVVCRLAEWARGLAELLDGAVSSVRCASNVRHASARASDLDSAESAVTGRRASFGSVAPSRRTKRTKARPRVKGRKGYPKFYRQRGQLVKVGWSKRSNAEYAHRAPRKIVSLLASKIVRASVDAEVVSTEDLLPIRDPHAHSDVPGYQAYLCLAWLREEGLLTPKGRQGYVVEHAPSLCDSVEKRWDVLPERSM